MFNFFPSKCLTDRSIKKLNKNVLQEGENMEKGTVKRRIFISNALMVLTTLVIFLLINMVVVKIYTESIEVVHDNGVGVPILMVTARTESVDKIRGLGLGADDYIGDSATVMVHVNRIREKIEDDPKNLVNSFGATIMAAFAAAVKIDTFAYLPVQDFGNAFSTFVAQNYGAGNKERIRKGTRVPLE